MNLNVNDPFLSILPPIVAIFFALMSKAVHVSLLLGIFSGALIFANGDIAAATIEMFKIMKDKIGNNADILIFIVIINAISILISASGASKTYEKWTEKFIHYKRSALGWTMLLGALLFLDDFFNCLTVGAIMLPIIDRLKIPRVKLAYVINTMANAACVIIPISSWAVVISSSFSKDFHIDGFKILVETIPFNLYPILSVIFLTFIILTGRDFFTMRTAVIDHKDESDKFKVCKNSVIENSERGKVIDLILPIVILIILCIYGILYTGGINNGISIKEALIKSDTISGLTLGSFAALFFTAIFYLSRAVLSFKKFCDCLVEGIESIASAILVLCFAWTLSGICGKEYLNLGGLVSYFDFNNSSLNIFFPFAFFVIAFGISFATGTSWGTFGILIPIAAVFVPSTPEDYNFLVICVSAILSGATVGSQISPLSNITIMTSVSTRCRTIDHASTQLPYCLTVASCCAIGYLIDGLTQNGWLGLFSALLILSIIILFIRLKFSSTYR